MTARRLVSTISIIALGFPAQAAPAQPAAISVATCAGGSIAIPMRRDGPPMSGEHDCCKRACHAGDRRKKLAELEADGGPDESD